MWDLKLVDPLKRLPLRLQGFFLGTAAALLVVALWSWLMPGYRYEKLKFQYDGDARETVVRINEWTGEAVHIADSDPRTPFGPPLPKLASK